jgi:hypothetical protein
MPDYTELVGDSNFDVMVNFDYSYLVTKDSQQVQGLKDKNYQKNQDFKVECNPKEFTCKPITLIYNPSIKEPSDHTIQMLFKPTDDNKNFISGFTLEVYSSLQLVHHWKSKVCSVHFLSKKHGFHLFSCQHCFLFEKNGKNQRRESGKRTRNDHHIVLLDRFVQ